MMEIPHGEFEHPIGVFDHNKLKQISFVDYRIENWEIPFELKTSFFNVLSKLNEMELLLIVRETSSTPQISVIDSNKEEVLIKDSKEVISLIRRNKLDLADFIVYVSSNHEHFIYYDENFNLLNL